MAIQRSTSFGTEIDPAAQPHQCSVGAALARPPPDNDMTDLGQSDDCPQLGLAGPLDPATSQSMHADDRA
jgi:hypothetical protein